MAWGYSDDMWRRLRGTGRISLNLYKLRVGLFFWAEQEGELNDALFADAFDGWFAC